jgi:hypothetical protein
VLQAEILAACGSLPGVLLLANVVKSVPNPYGPGHLTFGLGEGSPDLVGAVDGRFIGLEVKVPGEKPEPHQARLHAAWRAVGCFVVVVTSVEESLAAVAALRQPCAGSGVLPQASGTRLFGRRTSSDGAKPVGK